MRRWRARTMDVMNPMGVLVAAPLFDLPVMCFEGSRRDSLFLASWNQAIAPQVQMSLNFDSRVELQVGLSQIVILAQEILQQSSNEMEAALIGSMRPWRHFQQTSGLHGNSHEVVEQRLREEVLYFFGTLVALTTSQPLFKRIQSYEYLATVVGQKDELLPMIVGEHLGEKARSDFEFLCSLHYFQSNSRLSLRLERVSAIEQALQERLSVLSRLPLRAAQSAALCLEKATKLNQEHSSQAVVFLPSAMNPKTSDVHQDFSERLNQFLSAGIDEFFFVDSFHNRLRWLERLAMARQVQRLEALRRDPLRAQSIFESRSGRQRMNVLSASSIDLLKAVRSSPRFSSLSIAMQEIIQTALEIDEIRVTGRWGSAPTVDFVVLLDRLCSLFFGQSLSESVMFREASELEKFLEASLRRQDWDSAQFERMISF